MRRQDRVSAPRALGIDGQVWFVANFKPLAGNSYTVVADANDIHGDDVVRTFMLVAPPNGCVKRADARRTSDL
jgi:hypothetical protein